jgi:chaperonin GroES
VLTASRCPLADEQAVARADADRVGRHHCLADLAGGAARSGTVAAAGTGANRTREGTMATAVADKPKSKLRLKPLGARVVIKALERDEMTKSGIVLPDTAKEKPQEGRVLAVGPGDRDEDGKRIPVELKEGDRVLFQKYSGTEFKIDDEELLILNEKDILATVSES